MFKYTTTTLNKIEQVYKESGYIIRYEKGNFNSGYCILESKKVVVINKFFDLESRVNSLIEILGYLDIQPEALTEKSRDNFNEFIKIKSES